MLEGRTIPRWYYLQWHAFRHLRRYQGAAKTSKITVTLLNHCPAPTTFFGTLGVPSSKLLEISYWIWAEVDKTWELQSIILWDNYACTRVVYHISRAKDTQTDCELALIRTKMLVQEFKKRVQQINSTQKFNTPTQIRADISRGSHFNQ